MGRTVEAPSKFLLAVLAVVLISVLVVGVLATTGQFREDVESIRAIPPTAELTVTPKLDVAVVAIETVPVLRYATRNSNGVIRQWRITPSREDLELVLVRMKIRNTTTSTVNLGAVRYQAELRDFGQGTYDPIDFNLRRYQDLRGWSEVTVHMSAGVCHDPNRMFIDAGTKVTWVNEGSVDHFVNNIKVIPGGSYSFIFGTPRTWDYQCSPSNDTAPAPPKVPTPDLTERIRLRLLPEPQIVVEEPSSQNIVKNHPLYFINDFVTELQQNLEIDGWLVFEAPDGTRFRELRWRGGDSVTVPLP